VLNCISYISQSSSTVTDDTVVEIIQHAMTRNRIMSVSGVLYVSAGHFFQYIEGDSDTVTELFAKIKADPRHHDVRKLGHHKIAARLFPDFQMKLVDGRKLLSTRAAFDYHALKHASPVTRQIRLADLASLGTPPGT
jgi:hypothetical protein